MSKTFRQQEKGDFRPGKTGYGSAAAAAEDPRRAGPLASKWAQTRTTPPEEPSPVPASKDHELSEAAEFFSLKCECGYAATIRDILASLVRQSLALLDREEIGLEGLEKIKHRFRCTQCGRRGAVTFGSIKPETS